MTLTFKEVDQLLRIIEEFPADEIRFEYGELKLHVRRDGARAPSAQPNVLRATVAALPQPLLGAAAVTASASLGASSPAAAQDAGAAPVSREGLVPVLSPMMGVFYAAPSPDSPPFVTVGQNITDSTDLCIIEVMKVMNNIKAPCIGEIVEIGVENGAMVERGAAMFWIRPSAGSR